MAFSIFLWFVGAVVVVVLYLLVDLCRSEANKYTQEELMLMKTQDMGYILQKVQSEKKVRALLWIVLLFLMGFCAKYCDNGGLTGKVLVFLAENWKANSLASLYW